MVLTPFAYSKDSLYPTRISTYSHFCLTYISLSFNISTYSSLCHTYENMWLPCVGHTPHTHTSTCSSLTHSACILFIYFIFSTYNTPIVPPVQYWLGLKCSSHWVYIQWYRKLGLYPYPSIPHLLHIYLLDDYSIHLINFGALVCHQFQMS